jgi:hypothetical protein
MPCADAGYFHQLARCVVKSLDLALAGSEAPIDQAY